MKTELSKRVIRQILSVLICLFFIITIRVNPSYGIDRWVDTVQSGRDLFDIYGMIQLDTDGDGVKDASVDLFGSMDVFYGNAYPGNPSKPDYNNTIDTEMVSLNLTGNSSTLGLVIVKAGDGIADLEESGPLSSLGKVVEDPSDSFHVDSFFDVFFEITIETDTFHTEAITKLKSDSFHVDSFFDVFTELDVDSSNLPIPMFDPSNELAPLTVPDLRLGTLPEPSAMLLFGYAAVAIFGLGKRKFSKRS